MRKNIKNNEFLYLIKLILMVIINNNKDTGSPKNLNRVYNFYVTFREIQQTKKKFK